MDIIIYVSIAIAYNIFVHNLASSVYQDCQYEEKIQNTLIMIILFGGMGILISKIIKNNNKNKENNISKGLFYGGCLLLITAFIANWDSIMEQTRMFMATGALACLLWYAYTNEKKTIKKNSNNSNNNNGNKIIKE